MQNGGSRVQSVKNHRLSWLSKQPSSRAVLSHTQTHHAPVLLLLLGVPSLPVGTAALAHHLFRAFLHHFHLIPCPCR